MATKQFVSGMYFDRHERAPDFVVGRVSFNRAKFIQWLEDQDANDKDYVNTQIKRSKDGKYYVELDTWKPSGDRPVADHREPASEIDFDDAAF